MDGVVIQSTGSWYAVKLSDGSVVDCRIKGKFRLQEKKVTNPVAVGDIVTVVQEGNDAVINSIHTRKNYIVRSTPHKKEHKHILAANIDQCIVIASVAQPRTSYGFIDRVLLTAYVYDIPAAVVFNKSDLIKKKKEENITKTLIETYVSIGHTSFSTSVVKKENLDLFRELLSGKISLLCGHSGVGKTTLINAIEPSLDLKVQEISRYTEKGQHTTTFARMYDLSSGAKIIDTPGIKEFGIVDIGPEELGHYFPEMRERMQQCRFNNCVHINEEGCAVLNAVDTGEIAATRYLSYLSFYDELVAQKQW